MAPPHADAVSVGSVEYDDDFDQDDFAPLVKPQERNSRRQPAPTTSPSAASVPARMKWFTFFLFVLLLFVSTSMEYGFVLEDEPSKHHSSASKATGNYNVHFPTTYRSDLQALQKSFSAARENMIKKLEGDYGKENVHNIFFDGQTSRGRLFRSPNENGPSWERFQRKMTMKLLQTLSTGQSRRRRLIEPSIKSEHNLDIWPQREGLIPFVWATGGHSSAAGHGNLFHQSYTAVMKRTVSDVFAAAGLDFVGRNYAAGNTPSGFEVGACINEIFGLDIDVLSWDFAITDGRDTGKMVAFHTRAGMNPSRPIGVNFGLGSSLATHKNKINALCELEDQGLAQLLLDKDDVDKLYEGFPDSAGKTEEEVDEMPEFVSGFRCGTHVESKEVGCAGRKFDTSMCNDRKSRVAWHPGMNYHAAHGNLMALFLTDVLEDALNSLAKSDLEPTEMLQKLKSQEDGDYERFMASELASLLVANGKGTRVLPPDIDENLVFRGPNICHTARLPAETRHLGILTESTKTGSFFYDQGIAKSVVDAGNYNGLEIPLVYDENRRTENKECPVTVFRDFKDFFYIRHGDDWKELTLPNDSELAAYGSGQPFHGLIAVCPPSLPSMKGYLKAEDIKDGLAKFEVNGQAVVSISTIYKTCYFLEGQQGHYWPADSSGKYTIRARVQDTNSEGSLSLSSIIIW